jgi:hypothetical protein
MWEEVPEGWRQLKMQSFVIWTLHLPQKGGQTTDDRMLGPDSGYVKIFCGCPQSLQINNGRGP